MVCVWGRGVGGCDGVCGGGGDEKLMVCVGGGGG